MGKRIISQARGRGGLTYRVRKKAFKYKLGYPKKLEGNGEVLKLLNSSAHSAPLAKIKTRSGIFFIPAFEGMFESQKITFEKSGEKGSILKLKDIPLKARVYCIESRPGDGGRFIKTSGSSAVISRIADDGVYIQFPSKKEKKFNSNCRAVIGEVAGSGRLEKPIMKAGKRYHIKKSKGKLWPRTSAVKVNKIDHPFGSGRGKNPKSKIAKRNASPGKRVGLLRPKKTGKKR